MERTSAKGAPAEIFFWEMKLGQRGNALLDQKGQNILFIVFYDKSRPLRCRRLGAGWLLAEDDSWHHCRCHSSLPPSPPAADVILKPPGPAALNRSCRHGASDSGPGLGAGNRAMEG
ncbi:hypothetical protein E2320_020637, partial [Naja naja]